MLIMESTKIEYTGGHIGIMLIIEITKLEVTGHIRNMLIVQTFNQVAAILDYTEYRDYL